MKHEEIQALIAETLAEEIASRVLQKLVERQKRALVVYTGSTIAFDSGLESLNKLRGEGFRFDVFLSQSAAELLDAQRIRATLQPEHVFVGQADVPPELLAAPYLTVLVPALTANTTAKMAACQADSPAARLIFNSMMRGKNVVIALDGSCPDNPVRAEKGYRIAEPLKERMRRNLEELKSFGAKLTTADRLAEATLRVIGAAPKADSKPAAPSCSAVSQPMPQTRVGKKVLGRSDVAACPPGGTLLAGKGTLVTQMAKDTARTRGVRILYE